MDAVAMLRLCGSRQQLRFGATRRAAALTRGVHTEKETRVLITGGEGQIGSELKGVLRKKFGKDNVIVSDIRKPSKASLNKGQFIYLDVLDEVSLSRVVVEHSIDLVIHNSSLLSAVGEKNPQLAMKVNVQGLHNVMEVARKYDLRLFVPSSIAAFGPSTPRDNTPDTTIMRPSTIYGVTKVYAELLGEYYFHKFGVDFRSLRYPGIISSESLPGGGTTDYAVDIFYEALKKKSYTCFLKSDSALPMMYMPDCIKATINLIEAPAASLTQRVYNVSGVSFTPADLTKEIQKHIPEFQIDYQPDFRQAIADSWPNSLDDSQARKDWGWNPKYDLPAMTKDMIDSLSARLFSQKSDPLEGKASHTT